MNTLAAFIAFAFTWNNPHLDMAVRHKAGLFPQYESYSEFYGEYLNNTKSGKFYKRKPRSGDEISHDELLGIFYNIKASGDSSGLGKKLAQDILSDGGRFYSFEANKYDPARYVMRIFEMRGIVNLEANGAVDFIDQILWAGSIVGSALSKDDGCSHHLREWIASDFADQVYLPAIAMTFYRVHTKARGITLPGCIAQYYPNNPEMLEAVATKSF